jgi:hypothetical protein
MHKLDANLLAPLTAGIGETRKVMSVQANFIHGGLLKYDTKVFEGIRYVKDEMAFAHTAFHIPSDCTSQVWAAFLLAAITGRERPSSCKPPCPRWQKNAHT